MAAPVLTANSPSPGFIAWTAFNIQYLGVSYAIAAGNTNLKYTWWAFNGGAGGPLQSSDTFPSTLTDDDLLLFLNRTGVPVNAQSADVVYGDLMVPGSILASALAAATITGDKLAAGTVTASNMAVGVGMNAIANPSFEGTNPHTAASGATLGSSLAPHSGTYALGITLPTLASASYVAELNGPRSAGASHHLAVKNGDTIHAEFWVRTGNIASTAQVLLYVTVCRSDGFNIRVAPGSPTVTLTTTSTTYQRLSFDYKITDSNAAYVSLQVGASGTTAGDLIYVDDAMLATKTDGSLLVSGTVTADSIAAKAIEAQHLDAQLEITNHFISPKKPNIHDWITTAPVLTQGAMSTTGGTLTSTNTYEYWVEALMPSGLYTRLSNGFVTASPTTSTATQAMSWTAVPTATNYRVWRWAIPNAGGSIQQGYQTVGNVTSFTDTGAGWTTTSNLPTQTSNARLDIGPDGMSLYDDYGLTTVSLANTGVVSFTNEVIMSPGAPSGGSVPFSSYMQCGYAYSSDGLMTPYPLFILSMLNGDATIEYTSDAPNLPTAGGTLFVGTPDSGISFKSDGTAVFSGVATGKGATPVGTILMSAAATTPGGWLSCQGQSLLRSAYPALFAAIGTMYGSADSTHFNLPDLRGRFPIGYDSAQSNFNVLGAVESNSTGNGGTAPGAADMGRANHQHTHSITAQSGGTAFAAGTGGTNVAKFSSYDGHAHGGSTGSGGVGTGNQQFHGMIALNFIIFTGV